MEDEESVIKIGNRGQFILFVIIVLILWYQQSSKVDNQKSIAECLGKVEAKQTKIYGKKVSAQTMYESCLNPCIDTNTDPDDADYECIYD